MPRLKLVMGAVIASIVATAFFLTTPGNAERDNDFYFMNSSGATITELYVSQGHEGTWGPDRLGNQVLPHGHEIFVAPRRVHCRYDFRMVWNDGSSFEVPRKINLCEVSRVTVHCNRNTCWVKDE